MSFTSFSLQSKKEAWLQKFARVGLSAKGLVYCLLALIAFITALGLSSRKSDKEEAFKMIGEQPFGKVLLLITGLSLIGYVMLRFFQAFRDSDHTGSGVKAFFRRAGFAFSGLIYAGISFYAIKMALGESSEGDTKKQLIARVLEYPGGKLAVGLVAALVIGQGLYQIYRGLSKKFMKKVELHHSDFKKTFEKTGMAGHVSRGLVLCLIGYFILRAAVDSNPHEAEGTGGAFDFLKETGGNWLMGIVALGLFAYGIFMFVRAAHQKISL